MRKNLKAILKDAGYHEPEDVYPQDPGWQEPYRKRRQWKTIGDLFSGAGGLISGLKDLVISLVAVAFWLVVIAFLIFCMTTQCNGDVVGGNQVGGSSPLDGWEIAIAVSFMFHAIYEHVLNIGETGSTKSNTQKIIETERALEEDTVVVWLDPQPDSSALSFYEGCCELGIACIHIDLDSDWIMPCQFLPASDNPRTNAKNIDLLMEALGAYKGHERTYNRVLTMQFARPMCLVQMFTGLPWSKLKDAWNSDINGEIIAQCRDKESVAFMKSLPRRGSTLNRELEPAKRYLEVLMGGPSIRMMDSSEDRFIECLDEGISMAISAGRVISQPEACFLFSFRLMQIFDAAMQGRLKKKVKVVLEEADLQGVPMQVVRGLQGLAKYGVTISLISQNGFFGNEDAKTELIWNNTNRLIHRLSGKDVLERAVKDLEMLLDPLFVKSRRHQLRQIQSGIQEYESTSETIREKGGSKTIGKRERPIWHRYYETTEQYMSLQEQASLLKGVIRRQGNGCGIYNVSGEIETFQLPRYEQWIGRKVEELHLHGYEPTQVPASNWLKKVSLIPSKLQQDTSISSSQKNAFDASDL